MTRLHRLRGLARSRTLRLALAAGLVALGAGGARAQDGVAGTWWVELRSQDRGALLLGVGPPHEGAVAIQDTETEQTSFGYSQAVGVFFQIASGQLLTIDSKGSVVGPLALTDPETGGSVGTLTLESSKLSKQGTRWKLRGTIGSGASPVRVTLHGERLPQTFPVLSGGGPSTRLSGKGVSSKAFDVHVVRDGFFDLPAYLFDGAGSARIDGVEEPSTTLSGGFLLAPSHRIFGRLEESSHFGVGEVKGTLELPKDGLVPKLHLIARADRKVVAHGKLSEPNEPVLSVQPRSLDFAASHLGDASEASLALTNVGTGLVSGEAQLVEGSSSDFSLVAGASYADLAPGDPAHNVTVRFQPSSAGAKSAQILFDVNGGRVGAQIVTLSGVGGLATLEVDPEAIEFPDTVLGAVATELVTVRNVGDGPLEGSATLSGDAAFELAESALGPAQASIDYELDAGEELDLVVRFRPLTPGSKSATLQLTGGGGASVALSGSTL